MSVVVNRSAPFHVWTGLIVNGAVNGSSTFPSIMNGIVNDSQHFLHVGQGVRGDVKKKGSPKILRDTPAK